MPKRKTKKSKAEKNTVNLHNLFSVYDNPPQDECCMIHFSFREKSFHDWPLNEKSSCNPQTLAEAGFYHIPTKEAPDATRCFACQKELDGWEEEDDPWAEHRKHSPKCIFLAIGKKNPEDYTVRELVKLETERRICCMKKYYHMKMDELKEMEKQTKEQMTGLNPH